MNIQEIKEMAKLNREFKEKVMSYCNKRESVFSPSCPSEIEYVGVEVHNGEECAVCNYYQGYDYREECFIPIVDILKSEKDIELSFKDDVMKFLPKYIEDHKMTIKICTDKIDSGNVSQLEIDSLRENIKYRKKALKRDEAILDKYMKL